MLLENAFRVMRERVFQGRLKLILWTGMTLIIFLSSLTNAATSTTFPVAIKPGDVFTYKVLNDQILVSVNGTTYVNDTYLVAPTDKVLIKVLNVQNISEDRGIWGLNTIVNQSETVNTPNNNETIETFSYVNGWLDSYHFGVFSTMFVLGAMTRSPQLYKFNVITPQIQASQKGLPVFVTTNNSYYEAIMSANPPPEDQSEYSLSYNYDKEQGIYMMNHTMKHELNGTLPDNTTKWSLQLDFEFFLDTTFSKSIVNELKSIVFWDVRVGNASQILEWKLHVTLESTSPDTTAAEGNTSRSTTIAVPTFIFVISLGVLAIQDLRKRKLLH